MSEPTPKYGNSITVSEYKKLKKPKGCKRIEDILDKNRIVYLREHKFLDNRKFRFDYFFVRNGKKIGVEYDGLMSAKSRHTTVTGFSKDCEKMNLAQLNGFIVLRYTVLNVEQFENDLKLI